MCSSGLVVVRRERGSFSGSLRKSRMPALAAIGVAAGAYNASKSRKNTPSHGFQASTRQRT